jgi:hypothetical protein
VRRPGSEDPHRRELKFLNVFHYYQDKHRQYNLCIKHYPTPFCEEVNCGSNCGSKRAVIVAQEAKNVAHLVCSLIFNWFGIGVLFGMDGLRVDPQLRVAIAPPLVPHFCHVKTPSLCKKYAVINIM